MGFTPTTLEDVVQVAPTRKETDIAIHDPVKTYHLDISVTHPQARSFRRAASENPLAAASLRESVKLRKYAQPVQAIGAEFVPFVVETSGALGRRAAGFLKRLAKSVASRSGMRWQLCFVDLLESIAVAVQVGNAEMARSAAINARVHAEQLGQAQMAVARLH